MSLYMFTIVAVYAASKYMSFVTGKSLAMFESIVILPVAVVVVFVMSIIKTYK